MDACLVDAYGTIVDAEFGARSRELSEMAGVATAEWRDAYARMDGALGVGHMTRAEAYDLILRTCGVKPRASLIRELTARDRELLLSTGYVFEDTMPFLESLRSRGIAIAIVSNCGEYTPELLSSLGVAALADTLVLSFEVGCAKPSPRIYRIALERLGVAADSALFIDDQPVFCAGAEAVGVTAVQIVRGGGRGPGKVATAVGSLLEVAELL